MRLKEPHSFNFFFFFLSQIHLDFIWPISIAHCCGEFSVIYAGPGSERSRYNVERVASYFFRKIFSA